jgi:hypothetical protein
MRAIILTVVKATRQALPASARVEAFSPVWLYPQTGMGGGQKPTSFFQASARPCLTDRELEAWLG